MVIDTDVWVAGVRGSGDAHRVLQRCLDGQYQPLMGAALLAKYEDVMGRPALWKRSRLSAMEREELLDIFLSVCGWTHIYFAWRPNLSDEADNHVIELAVAGQAKYVVTRNTQDLRQGELRFPQLRVMTPGEILKETS